MTAAGTLVRWSAMAGVYNGVMSRSALALAVFGAVLSAHAASPVGKWTGTIEPKIDKSKLNKQQLAQMDAALAQVRSMKIALTIKANKTFTVGAANNPGQTQSGTWKQVGNVIEMTSSNPQNPSQKKTQKVNLSPDGKRMTMTAVSPQGSAIITFRKG